MSLSDRLRALARAYRQAADGVIRRGIALHEDLHGGEQVAAVQMRPTRWLDDGSPDPTSYRPVH